MMIFSVNRILTHIGEGVVHPAHIPLVGKTETTCIGRLRDTGPGRGLFRITGGAVGMDNFIEMLDLEPALERVGIKNTRRNFEDIFSELYEINPSSSFLKEIEKIIYTYFESLKLPESPTIYDHLLMSLRPKDIVATFNWDPFLFDAWEFRGHHRMALV